MICDDKLLPCPFCGSTRLLLRNLEMHTTQFYVIQIMWIYLSGGLKMLKEVMKSE